MSTLITNTIQGVQNIKYDASTTAMTIDSSGRVLKPVIPFGQASSNAKTTATNIVNLNTHVISGGGVTVDQTNNRMVVPVTGLYQIGFTELTDVAAYVEIIMRKNGSNINGARAQTGTSHQYGEFGHHMLISLAANDYIDWYCQAGTTHNNSEYNNHYVYLIG
tara:strand:- start:585 stop:1073 length:489 start_codon:yes stop_codon:yes gene_type:complete